MLNGGQLMVVLIVAVVMISGIIKARHKHDAQRAVRGDGESAEAARLRGEVQQLRERIQVLERVITDSHSSVDLDRQIENLRDR